MDMQELIAIEAIPASLTVNFDQIKNYLSERLQAYDVVVTADTVKDAKALATELNKTKTLIETRRKEVVAEASEPVRRFEGQMKELASMVSEGRQSLLDQVKKFEDETREKVQELVEALRLELWSDYSVAAEFQNASLEGLVNLSNLTTKGNLTSKARDEIKTRVMFDKALQDRTEKRLLELENRSYQAGLSAPLTRDHVAHFLFEDDEKYTSELERILGAEIERERRARQAEAERQQRQQEAEQAAQQQVQQPINNDAAFQQMQEAEQQQAADSFKRGVQEAYIGSIPEPAPCEDGKVWVAVHCSFQIQVPHHVTDAQIAEKLRGQMASAGFQSEPSIYVER